MTLITIIFLIITVNLEKVNYSAIIQLLRRSDYRSPWATGKSRQQEAGCPT